MERGELARAREVTARLKGRRGADPVVWALASEISLRLGRLDDALAELDEALRLDPRNPRRHAQRARCAILAGRADDARASVALALEHGVARVDDLLLLASVLVRCDDQAGALRLYLQAERLAPERAEVQRGLATVYRFVGEIDLAEKACDRAIAADPHDYEMLNLRSTLRRQRPDANHVEELKALLAGGTIRDWRGAVQVGYALAKELEDLGDYTGAFRYLKAAASVRRRNTRYDVADDVRIFDALRAAFTADALAAHRGRGRGHDSTAPIFVLGLPRTGSTLIERIISSHSAVSTAGELNDFAVEMLSLVREAHGDTLPDRLALPAASLRIDHRELGHRYLASAQPRAPGAARFIDKLPLNSLYVGLIHLALPNARIVHVRRHPVDTCFAMYKYLFKNAYPFSYDLDELAAYYVAHHRLMDHWRAVLPPGAWHEIHYEDVVADQEGATRRLLEYLGLPWEDACLQHERNAQPSTTGSASQVRQPIYASSIGHWRHFEHQLEPLVARLRDAGIAIEGGS